MDSLDETKSEKDMLNESYYNEVVKEHIIALRILIVIDDNIQIQ